MPIIIVLIISITSSDNDLLQNQKCLLTIIFFFIEIVIAFTMALTFIDKQFSVCVLLKYKIVDKLQN